MAELGRRSALRDPTFLRRVAECFYSGMSRTEMCDELGVKDKDTITRWRRDERVKAIVQKLNSDRAIQVSSKVDASIQGRLANPDNLSVDELIRIRKEYGGPAVKRTEADDAVLEEAMSALEDNPDLADEFEELLKRGSAETPPEQPTAEE